MDDPDKARRISVRKGDGCLVIPLGLISILTFSALGFLIRDKVGNSDAIITALQDILITASIILALGITLLFFQPRWLEKALLQTFLKLLAFICLLIVLIFLFAK